MLFLHLSLGPEATRPLSLRSRPWDSATQTPPTRIDFNMHKNSSKKIAYYHSLHINFTRIHSVFTAPRNSSIIMIMPPIHERHDVRPWESTIDFPRSFLIELWLLSIFEIRFAYSIMRPRLGIFGWVDTYASKATKYYRCHPTGTYSGLTCWAKTTSGRYVYFSHWIDNRR